MHCTGERNALISRYFIMATLHASDQRKCIFASATTTLSSVNDLTNDNAKEKLATFSFSIRIYYWLSHLFSHYCPDLSKNYRSIIVLRIDLLKLSDIF